MGAGWNPDPYQRHEQRYWDGVQWTHHVNDGGVVAIDPVYIREGDGGAQETGSVAVRSVGAHQREPAAIPIGWLTLVGAGLFLVGLYVPYLSGPGQQSALADSGGSTLALYIVPAVVAILAAFGAIGGRSGGAGIAAGATFGLAMVHALVASVVVPIVNASRGFGDSSTVGFGAGFWLHTTGAICAVLSVMMILGALSDWKRSDERRVSGTVSGLCVVALLLTGLAVFLPRNGVSILDIEDGWTKAAFIGFGAGLPVLGWIGAARRTRSGVGLALGCAVVFVTLTFANAFQSSARGGSFFAGFNQGQETLYNIAAVVAVVMAGIGMLSMSASSTRALEPATVNPLGWGTPHIGSLLPSTPSPSAAAPLLIPPTIGPSTPAPIIADEPAAFAPPNVPMPERPVPFSHPQAGQGDQTIRKPPNLARPPAPAYVVSVDDGRQFSLAGTILVGRSPSSERFPGATLITINDPGMSVSKTHLMLVDADGTLGIEDLGSTNGVDVSTTDHPSCRLVRGVRTSISPPCTITFGDRHLTIRPA